MFRQRIGPINMFNPYLPDGHYELELRSFEDRAVAEMLVKLSSEPGESRGSSSPSDVVYPGNPWRLRGDQR
jgi:hypothetical protein